MQQQPKLAGRLVQGADPNNCTFNNPSADADCYVDPDADRIALADRDADADADRIALADCIANADYIANGCAHACVHDLAQPVDDGLQCSGLHALVYR